MTRNLEFDDDKLYSCYNYRMLLHKNLKRILSDLQQLYIKCGATFYHIKISKNF